MASALGRMSIQQPDFIFRSRVFCRGLVRSDRFRSIIVKLRSKHQLIAALSEYFTIAPMRDRLERIESVKAGSLCGITAGIGDGSMIAIDRIFFGGHSLPLISLSLEIAIAIAAAFLFGVTYRYIIRTDDNNHLNSGAVLAFALVRGLAQVDVREFGWMELLMNGVIVGESVLLFTICRYAIDYALSMQWILPFKS